MFNAATLEKISARNPIYWHVTVANDSQAHFTIYKNSDGFVMDFVSDSVEPELEPYCETLGDEAAVNRAIRDYEADAKFVEALLWPASDPRGRIGSHPFCR